MQRPDLSFFPNRELAIGDKWSFDAARVRQMLGGGSGTVRCEFAELTDFDGHPCARIHVTMNVTQKDPTLGGPVKMELDGDMHYALDLRRPLSMTASGPVTASGHMKIQGSNVTIQGNGNVDVTENYHWIKVAGKLAPAGTGQ